MAHVCGSVRRLNRSCLVRSRLPQSVGPDGARLCFGLILGPVDRAVAEEWIEAQVHPVRPTELIQERPWSTILRVPLADGVAWFKACSSLQAFEPRLTTELFTRWPDRVPEVIAFDENRRWLLMADAGVRIGELGNRPEYWLRILPLYAELQRGEVALTRNTSPRVFPTSGLKLSQPTTTNCWNTTCLSAVMNERSCTPSVPASSGSVANCHPSRSARRSSTTICT